MLERAGQATALDGRAAGTYEVSAEQVDRDFGRTLVAQPPLPETFVIHFLLSTVRMTPESIALIPQLAARIRARPAPELLIVGHTDAKGSSSYNIGLSDRRALTAAGYIASQGVERDRVGTVGRGEDEPITTNSTDDGRRLNRRVEVAIFAKDT